MHYQTILLQIPSNVSDLTQVFTSLNLANNFPPLDPNHPDSIVIKPSGEASIGIGEVAHLQTWVAKKPFQSENKLAVIHLADQLTVQAQNSLLKTLEEPPPHTLIVLTALNPNHLLDTILSRTILIQANLDKPGVDSNLQNQARQFFDSNYLEKIRLVEEIAQPKKFLALLTNIILATRSLTTNQKLAQWELIKTSLKALDSNVQPKIALENLSLWLSEY